MKNKWIKKLLMVGAVATMLFSTSIPAFAYVDESAVLEETFTGEEVTETETETEAATETEPTTTETTGDAFSVEGNGTVLDDVVDSSGKEFYTIQTANNNTYFMVIDHSSSVQNVYMLSMIDENDLKEFLDEESETETEVTVPSVVLEEETTEETETAVEEPEETSTKNSQVGTLAILALLGAGVAGGYYYLKFYKPKKDGDFSDDEDLEYLDDETVNEDETETSSEKDYSEEDEDEEGFDIEDDEY
jgi:hypothetical protein